MKKILLLGVFALFLSGCGGGVEYNCTIDGKDATITLKDGMVSSYTLDGKNLSSSEIDEINGEYFTGVATDEDGKNALDLYVGASGGSCQSK